jgi:hypothetical protein
MRDTVPLSGDPASMVAGFDAVVANQRLRAAVLLTLCNLE